MIVTLNSLEIARIIFSPRWSLHETGNTLPSLSFWIIILKFDPSINRVSCFSMLCLVQTFEFHQWCDTKVAKSLEGVKNQETPGCCPRCNWSSSCNVDAQLVPWIYCVPLKKERSSVNPSYNVKSIGPISSVDTLAISLDISTLYIRGAITGDLRFEQIRLWALHPEQNTLSLKALFWGFFGT